MVKTYISIPNRSPVAKYIETKTVDIMTLCFNTAVKRTGTAGLKGSHP